MDVPRPSMMTVNGTTLTYLEQGEGTPFVFVHGALGDYRDWLNQIEPFAEHYRTVVYSRRGHYPNAWPADYSACDPEVHAADLAALIESLDAGPVHLFGHSIGGVTALVLAARRPDLVRTLILGEPPLLTWLGGSAEGRAMVASFMANALEPAQRAFQQGGMEEGVRRFLDGVIGPGAFDQIPVPVQATILQNAPELKVQVLTPPRILFSTLTCDDLSRMTMPVLLLEGELSPPMFSSVADEIASCLPTVERATIPGVSHDLYNPPVFQETVLGFLARHA